MWPSSIRGRVSKQMLSQVVLGGLLVTTLALSARDAVPTDGYDPAAWPTQAGARFVAPAVRQPSFALTVPTMSNLSAWTTTTGALTVKALIPTAAPVQLLIPSIRVNRPVEGVGVDRWGFMKLPMNGWNAGWYAGGPVPGAPGDAVIEGHAGYPDQPMLFGRLATLKQGDKIIVVLADGSQRLFLVQSMAAFPIGVAPPGMAEQTGPPRLTLVTCTGHFDAESKFYSKRLVVEASYAGTV
jgi:LPXTG-site transpeptidase (sortase) family protein